MKTVRRYMNRLTNKKASIKGKKNIENNIPNDSEEKKVESLDSEIVISKVSEFDSTVLKTDADILELEKKKKTYWNEETELAVVDFLQNDFNYYNVQLEKYLEDCNKKKKPADEDYVYKLMRLSEETSCDRCVMYKDKVFRDKIQKPLNKLVENIIFNFKLFRPGVDIKTLHNDCLSFVYGKFANFNPVKNTKSFSYFGTVAKHYLQGEKKELDKFIQTNLDYDDHRDEADGVDTVELDEKSELETSLTLFNYIIDLLEQEMDRGDWPENDIKVADAIVQIFKNHDILGAYNKIHVYHLIKESTNLQTKDITYSLGRIRKFYTEKKQIFIKKEDD